MSYDPEKFKKRREKFIKQVDLMNQWENARKRAVRIKIFKFLMVLVVVFIILKLSGIL